MAEVITYESSSSSSDGEGFNEEKFDINTNSIEKIEEFINLTKTTILESSENTEHRKRLVQKLIKLRIRYQDLLERQSELEHLRLFEIK